MLTLSSSVQLRPYQEEALNALWEAWGTGAATHPLIVLPTGAGKSLLMAELCRRAMEWDGTRICVLAHRGELVGQNAEAIEQQTGTRVGVFSAGLRSRDTDYPITVASIQSIYKAAPKLDPFDLVIIDEAHRIPPSGTARYSRFLSEVRLQNPLVKFVGLTATPFRMGSGRLDRGPDRLFDSIVYEARIVDLIRDGYLSEVVSRGGIQKIDVSNVKVRGGEFVSADLERATDKPDVIRAAVTEIVEFGADRKGWLIFTPGISSAHHVVQEVQANGISCSVVTGETPAGERARTIELFKSQRIRCLVSVEVFLEGFNAPHVDLIGMMRPTKSPVLYIQAVGRGFRTFPGKENCLLLDYAGVVEQHGPIDQIQISEPRSKNTAERGEPPAKECPSCRLIVAAGIRTCPGCGHSWPAPSLLERLQRRAFDGAVLSTQRSQELMQVLGMTLSKWEPMDPSRPATLLVTYQGPVRQVREWLCPEHTGYARTRFEHRCRTEWGIVPPGTIKEAIERVGEIPVPSSILVRSQKDNPKFLEVLRRFYPENS